MLFRSKFTVNCNSGAITTPQTTLDDGSGNMTFLEGGATITGTTSLNVNGGGTLTLHGGGTALNVGGGADLITLSTTNASTTGAIILNAASVPSSGSNAAIKFVTAGGNVIIASNASGTITVVSDENMKKDIKDSEIGSDFINALRVRSFRMKNDPEDEPLIHGLIWQEVVKAIDRKNFAGIYENGEDRGLNYNNFFGPIINNLKENNREIAILRQENQTLKSHIEELFSQTDRLVSGNHPGDTLQQSFRTARTNSQGSTSDDDFIKEF